MSFFNCATWSKGALLENLAVSELVKFSDFMEPEGSLPCSRKSATGPYSELVPTLPPSSLKSIIIRGHIPRLHLDLPTLQIIRLKFCMHFLSPPCLLHNVWWWLQIMKFGYLTDFAQYKSFRLYIITTTVPSVCSVNPFTGPHCWQGVFICSREMGPLSLAFCIVGSIQYVLFVLRISTESLSFFC
jgi:hypothetical protein